MTPYEQCLAFYRRWMSDYHMTPSELDDTDLELLLDIEVLDSKIEATAAQQRGERGKRKVFIDEIF